MPIEILKKLPKKARAIWESTYSAAKAKYGPERAAKIAWAAVKKKYKKKEGQWIKRTIDTLEFKSEQPYLRSVMGDIAKEYFVEGYIASTEPQIDGVALTRDFLEYVVDTQFKNPERALLKGDIEHAADLKELGRRIRKDVETDEDILRLVDYKIVDEADISKLWCRFQVDRTAKNFDKILYKLKNKFYDSFSASFSIDDGGSILERAQNGDYITKAYRGRLKRATLTGTPMDKLSVLTSFYTK